MRSDKDSVRKLMRATRNSLTPEERLLKTEIIKTSILGNFLNYSKYLLYYPIRGEVDVSVIVNHLGGDIFFPKVMGDDIVFIKVSSVDDLQDGYCGIKEPLKGSIEAVGLSDTAVFVPGLAFDKQGYRVGYGKGFYDRFFAQNPDICCKIGVCYEFQLVDDICPDAHDIKMDYIVTEEKVYDLR